MEAKTYTAWGQVGRQVIKGERARKFLAAPDLSQAVALFEEDQTTEIADPTTAGWIELSAEDWKRLHKERKLAQRPKPSIHVHDGGEQITVWAGTNKPLVEWLRHYRFSWSPVTRRWVSTAKTDLESVRVALSTSEKYNVVWD